MGGATAAPPAEADAQGPQFMELIARRFFSGRNLEGSKSSKIFLVADSNASTIEAV